MQETKIYCDICSNETDDYYSVDIKWCNEGGYHRYEVCRDCMDKSEILVAENERKNNKTSRTYDTFLGLIRFIFKRK